MQNHIVVKPTAEVYKTTITNTVASLPNLPDNALEAWIQIETADIRARFNATTDVTGGVGGGMKLANGNNYTIVGYDNLKRMRMYRDGGADGFINVVYGGEGQPS